MTGGNRGSRLGLAIVAGTLLALAAAAWVIATPPKVSTTLTIMVDPPTIFVGETATVTYKVTPAPDGGYVWDGQREHPVDPVTGIATSEYAPRFAGSYTLSAIYIGTDAYLGTTYVDAYVTVMKHDVVVAIDGPDAPVGRGDPFDIVVDVDPAPDFGRVALQRQNPDGGWSPFQWEVVAAGVAAFHFDWLDPGSYTLRGVYEGSDVYAGATTPTIALEVFDRPTTTTIETAPAPSLWGEPVTVNVSVHPVPDGGAVSIWIDGRQNQWVTMDWTTGTGSATLDYLDPGDHTIRAEFRETAGHRRWAPSEGSVTQTVSPQPLDTTAPVGTITIDHGNAIAPEGYCVLTLTVDEAHPGPAAAEISGDGMTWVRGTAWVGDFGWSLNDPAVGGFGAEGVHTIYARWTDWYGNVSEVASDSIILDYMPPIGTVYLPDGSYYHIWPDLTVDVTASDLGSGVDLVALSNDGAAWTELPYQAQVRWTVAPGDGEKTIHVKWRDGNGHWSDPKTRTIWVDTVLPTVTAPVPRLVVGSELASGRAPVQLGWTGYDAGGVDRYELSRSTDGGAWGSPARATTAKASVLLTPGHQYRFRVRAIDKAGNTGAWMTGTPFRVTAIQQSSRAVRWHGAWTTRRPATAWGGSTRTSSDAGATARVSVTGRVAAWVAQTGPNRGIATVYVDGTRVATVDLRSPTALARRVVWARSWSASKTRTITIKVGAAPGRPYVDLDGIVVIR